MLAQPTRARLFSLLSELRRPTVTAELAKRLSLHQNGVRLHLERMEQLGLIARARVRQRRGRPPDAWTIAPDAQPGGSAPRAYRDQGRWLARAVGSSRRAVQEIEQTGREIGQELAWRSDAVASEDFQPRSDANSWAGRVLRFAAAR